MEPPTNEGQTVRLVVPARPEFVGLARLALAGVCRLTPLGPADVADLKLAISEAANDLMDPAAADLDGNGPPRRLRLEIELRAGHLLVRVEADRPRPEIVHERELSRAIVEATVDEWDYEASATRLVKYL